MDNVKQCKPDLGAAGGGDACCTPLQGPDEELKGFLPKLNEVILDFISEDPDMKTG